VFHGFLDFCGCFRFYNGKNLCCDLLETLSVEGPRSAAGKTLGQQRFFCFFLICLDPLHDKLIEHLLPLIHNSEPFPDSNLWQMRHTTAKSF